MPALRIGELAERAGVGVETVRFYERSGLIADPPRAGSGYRQYPETQVARIRFIRRAARLGFCLDEVAGLLALRAGAAGTCGDVRRRVEAKVQEIDGRIADLERMRSALARLAGSCTGEDAAPGDCPIVREFDGRGER